MALLQNDKAIFYHPLDDSTESLKSQAWTLGAGSLAGGGKISLALSGTAGDLDSFGTNKVFIPSSAAQLSCDALSSTKFVVSFRDGNNGNLGRSYVGVVSGTDITFGAQATFAGANVVSQTSTTALSATTFVVAYQDQGDSNHGTAKVGTVSGTDITFGAETEFLSANGAASVQGAKLDSTTVVIAYQDASVGSGVGAANIGTVSGTDITFGSQHVFQGTSPIDQIDVAALSSTSIVVTYRDGSDTNHGTAKVGTVSGTDITFGAETEFLSVDGPFYISVTALDSAKFVVVYKDTADANHGTAKVGTVSGTDITFGAETEFLSTGAANYNSASRLSATTFVVAYSDAPDAGHGTARVGTVSGTDITFGLEVEFLSSGAVSLVCAATLSASSFVTAYRDDTSGSDGTASVGTLASGADLTASTPAAYDSVVAATKLAFCGWLKNPSA